ncbi:MAG: Lrp/AsnC family transcriptional regulator, partial [Dehalococcoidia bacterium]
MVEITLHPLLAKRAVSRQENLSVPNQPGLTPKALLIDRVEFMAGIQGGHGQWAVGLCTHDVPASIDSFPANVRQKRARVNARPHCPLPIAGERQRSEPMRAVFVMLKADPGFVHQVAADIAELDAFSEAYSISGQYDLLVKLYIETLDDLDRLVTEDI